MKCCKCNAEMREVNLCSGIYETGLTLIQKHTDKDDQRDHVVCWVCPDCGYIELYAKEPSKFK